MQDEWLRLIQDHPTVAFNYRNFNGTVNSPDRGFQHIYMAEPYIGLRENWDVGILRGYQTVITWNEKFYKNFKYLLPKTILVQGCLGCNASAPLQDLIPWESKIHGVCVLNHLYNTGLTGDIYWLRDEAIHKIGGDLARHVWCTKQWGGDCYQGAVDSPYHHSHVNQLKKISEYKFCLAFESSFHPFWSYGFVTERILNCFRAGTIPIYVGAYNIQEYVPTDLFIDFRQFWLTGSFRDYAALTKLLQDFSKGRYEDVVGRAYEWVKTCRIGSVPDLENALRGLS